MQDIIENNLDFSNKKKEFSQCGEERICSELFKQIGITNKYGIECGALDGVHGSNLRQFILDGWSALLIEADGSAFERLSKNYASYEKVQCVNTFISFSGEHTIDILFEKFGVPKDCDLFVLDIDGNEYHIWDSMEKYRPRLMVIEFNPTIPNEVSFVQPRDMRIQQGSSLRALSELAEKKDYMLVALTAMNAFFVRKTDAEAFKGLDNNLEKLRPTNLYETKLYQLYDGTLKISGNKKLIWNKLMIEEDMIQVLPKNKRFFSNGVSHKAWVRSIKHKLRNTSIYPLIRKIRKINFFRRIMQ